MPSKSGKQHRLMELVKHNPAAAKRLGIPQKVGADYVDADKASGKHFSMDDDEDPKTMAKRHVLRHLANEMKKADGMRMKMKLRPQVPDDDNDEGMEPDDDEDDDRARLLRMKASKR